MIHGTPGWPQWQEVVISELKALCDQQWQAQEARNRQVILEAPGRYGMTVLRPWARRLVDTDLGQQSASVSAKP